MEPGTVIAGKYRVERVLGEGGMGIVYAATHLGLRERVAIKMLAPELASHGVVVARFLREARAAAAIKGDHVVRVVDVDAIDGKPYIVMEYLEGESLADALAREGRFPLRRLVDHVLQACEALAEAHRLGIVHRDLKPGNLFLARRPDGSAVLKVLDFGISKFDPVEYGESTLTDTKHPLGTPLYMSPEQLASAARVDARTDIWALGVVLFEGATGRLPFASVLETLNADPTPDLTDDSFADVVMRCLTKSPDGRFTDVASLAEALRPWASSDGHRSIDRIARIASFEGAEVTLVEKVDSAATDRDPDAAIAFAETDPATTRPLPRQQPDTLGATSSAPTIPRSPKGSPRRAVFASVAIGAIGFAALVAMFMRDRDSQRTPPVTTTHAAPPVPVTASQVASASYEPSAVVPAPSIALPSVTSAPKKVVTPPKPKPSTSTAPAAKSAAKSNEDI